MMSRRGLLWLSTGLAMLGLAGCETVGVYRFRLTVEVDTPQGVRSGSSVMQVRYGVEPNINGGGQQADVDLDGEGVLIDLGGGRHVVALLGQALMQSGAFERRFLPAEVFYPDVSGPQQIQALKASGGNLQGSAGLTGDQIPSMATFQRATDPASARVVHGKALRDAGQAPVTIDDFAQVFGPGHGLKRVRLDMVSADTPITRRLEATFGWLADPAVMENPGWSRLPELSRLVIVLLRSGRRA